MKHVHVWGAAAVVISTLTSVEARAAIIDYSDRATFEAATGATTVEDFTTSYHYPITTGILNSSTNLVVANGTPITPGMILPGVTYSTSIGSGNFFNIDLGGGIFQGGFLDSFGKSQVLTITFDHAQSGFGFDSYDLAGNFVVDIYSGSTLLASQSITTNASQNYLTFYGFGSSSQNITSATITGDDDGGDTGGIPVAFALDDFTYNSSVSAPGPTPGTGLLTFGFLALVGLAKKVRAARA